MARESIRYSIIDIDIDIKHKIFKFNVNNRFIYHRFTIHLYCAVCATSLLAKNIDVDVKT